MRRYYVICKILFTVPCKKLLTILCKILLTASVKISLPCGGKFILPPTHFCPFCGFEQIVDGEFDGLDESLRKTLVHIKGFFSTRHSRSDADYFKNIIDNAIWLWRKELAKETDWAQKNALRYLAKSMLKDKHLIADYDTTNMRAQYILGVIYEYGLLDVKKDLDLALKYLN